MSNIIGVRNNNTIVSYQGATKRTKEVTVTINTAGWTANDFKAVFYADSASPAKWRMVFNAVITKDSGTVTDDTNITLVGVTFANLTTDQAVSGYVVDTSIGLRNTKFMKANDNTSDIRAGTVNGTDTFNRFVVSGDVALASEPTTYTTAANMEGVTAVDVYIAPASASAAGLVDTSAQSFAGVKTFTGFTSLGGDVALKCKKLTGTTSDTQGNLASVAHGLTGAKIVSLSGLVANTTNSGITPGGITVAGYHYYLSHDATNVYVGNHATDSANILSKSFTVLVWYIE